MRLIVLGLDGDWRSTVVRDEGLDEGGTGGASTLWSTDDGPPKLARRQDVAPLGEPLIAGTTRWARWKAPANLEMGLHRTNTLDYGTVLEGETVVIVETGEVALGPGDCVVIPDVLRPAGEPRPGTSFRCRGAMHRRRHHRLI